MILVIAVILGLAAGLCRAWIKKRSYRVYELKFPLLVVLAFIPQLFAFYLPVTRQTMSNNMVSILSVCSLTILLVFSLFNIRKLSFLPITLGFFCNFLVIVLNGGFMPVSPETLEKLAPGSSDSWLIGQRVAYSKDVVLTPELTRLWFLSDRLTLPAWMNYPVAFSVGDVLIAIGIFWLLWMLGGEKKQIL